MSFLVKVLFRSGLETLMQIGATGGYAVALYWNRDTITQVPFPLIGLGVAVLQFVLKNRIFKLGFFWILYSLLTYALISYHEFDLCILESCVSEELTSQVSIISTGVLWASLDVSKNSRYVTQVYKSDFSKNYKPDETIQLRWV